MEHDMSRGSPTRLILLFLLPLIGGNLFQQFYSMVDTIIVGRFLGVKALAAVGSTAGVTFFVLGFMVGLTAGFSAIISQKFGAKDDRSMKKAVAMSILTAGFASVVVSVFAVLLCKPLLLLLNTPYDIIEDAASYLTILFVGIVATIYYNLLASILRALGDSKSPLYFLLIASILNILGDLIAVLLLGMGVEGVALATVVSQSVSALLCLLYIVKRYPSLHLSRSDWSLEWPMIGNLLRIGIPSALQLSVCALGVMFVQAFINKMGSETVGAFSVGIRIEQLATLPLGTLGVAMITFAAQNFGAGRLDRVRQGTRSAIMLVVLFSAIALPLLLAFGDDLARLFIDRNNIPVIEKVQLYLNLTSPFYVPLGMIFVLRSACQGMGSGVIPMLSSMQELLFRVLVALTLPTYLGYRGICLASPIAWVAAAVLLIFAYRMQIQKLGLLLGVKQ
ncbi:MAG: MATE family efflux transporter [Sphaerochaeta sp.]|nr:MATE family efflux transporter [Sphaerochaeta sp.]